MNKSRLNIIIIFILSNIVFLQDCCEQHEAAIGECDGMVGCFIPQCTEDCNWEPTQCWESTGYCWCVNENGEEISGTSLPSWQGMPECVEFNMQNCDEGYVEINELCFFEQDLEIIELMIDNSYESEIDLGCQDGDIFCGSPNPYMDSNEAWMWVTVDSISYQWAGDDSGRVDPLELGIQEWNNGRLTSLMCGAYIYCQLSGPIPEEINQLTNITTLRLEYNYLSGFIPESICELGPNHDDNLAFDISGNKLCPPYPECIWESDFWFQDTSACTVIGDINYDFILNIQDIVLIILFILDEIVLDFQEVSISDINLDGAVNILDVIEIVNIILEN
jgi:hypothetical protein